MKVPVLQQPGSLILTRRNRPVPGRGQALVKVLAAGVCGSDLQAFQGSNPLQAYPCVPSHEICGEVAEVAPPAEHIKPGDRVVLDPMQSCGTCYPCRIGRYNCCTGLKVFGVHRDRGFAGFVAESTKRLFKVNPQLPPEEAALVEPFTVAAQALARARVRPEEEVAIFGAGIHAFAGQVGPQAIIAATESQQAGP